MKTKTPEHFMGEKWTAVGILLFTYSWVQQKTQSKKMWMVFTYSLLLHCYYIHWYSVFFHKQSISMNCEVICCCGRNFADFLLLFCFVHFSCVALSTLRYYRWNFTVVRYMCTTLLLHIDDDFVIRSHAQRFTNLFLWRVRVIHFFCTLCVRFHKTPLYFQITFWLCFLCSLRFDLVAHPTQSCILCYYCKFVNINKCKCSEFFLYVERGEWYSAILCYHEWCTKSNFVVWF